jgi:hypothetical protein
MSGGDTAQLRVGRVPDGGGAVSRSAVMTSAGTGATAAVLSPSSVPGLTPPM